MEEEEKEEDARGARIIPNSMFICMNMFISYRRWAGIFIHIKKLFYT